MPEEVAREQQDVSVACPTWCLRVFLHVIPRAGPFHCHSIAIIAGGYHCAHRAAPLTVPASQRLSAAGTLRRVAELAQLGYQPVTMLALNLDDALSDATARAAQFLQPRRELGELRFVKGQSADHRYTLAAAAGNFPTDAHARLVRGGARHGLRCGAGERPGLRRVPQHEPWCGVSGLHA